MIHDDRPELERWRPMLEGLWDPQAQPLSLVTYRGEAITYPLAVESFAFGRSATNLAIPAPAVNVRVALR
jgi:hypothetical protein